MSFSIGIVGLPNAGKSTLFKALTKKQVDIASYPFTTIQPNIGVVAVPDQRLEKIAGIIKPPKVTPTIIEFVDIAGLVKGAYKGEGLGNQFLAKIRESDAILEVVRSFENKNVSHPEGKIDPQRDIEIISSELIMKDLEIIERSLEKAKKENIKKFEILKKLKEYLEKEKPFWQTSLREEEKKLAQELCLITIKPIIYLINTKGNSQDWSLDKKYIISDLKLEEEISELSENEIREMEVKSNLDRVIKSCYDILDLITFYTITGGKETRAWTIKRGTKCPQAGGAVHSDFQEKFIRAEVINWQELVNIGSWQKAREQGSILTKGKDYVVQDGDLIEFKI